MLLKKTLLVLAVLVIALAAGVIVSYTSLKGTSLFANTMADWALLAVAIVGLVAGAARGMLKKKSSIKGDVVIRHGLGSFISHWGTGLGIFALLVSGVLMGVSLGWLSIGPFANTPAKVVAPLDLHYFAVALTLFCGFFFAGDFLFGRDWMELTPNLTDVTQGFIGKYMLRRKWTKETKYLSSQKAVVYPYVLIGLVLVATGAIKVASHIWPIRANVWGWATAIHDYFAVFILLYTLVHMAIVVMLGHWPAFFSWFTGTMTTHEVEHEHPVWYEQLQSGTNKT
jgi:cytochrome b subunit of formate dehydrogenase